MPSPILDGRAVSTLVCTLAAFAAGHAISAAETPANALDRAVAGLPPPTTPEPSRTTTPVGVRLIDVSLSILAAAGGSSADDQHLSGLLAGGHDPHRNGFTLQGAELSLAGVVDPYFQAEAHLVATEDGVELEEAFAKTTALPYRLEAKGGYQLIEFGRINASHPHSWAWLEQPVIASRLLGGDGTRSAGGRVAWLMPLPWFSQITVGAYNSNDPSAASFRGYVSEDDSTSVGGRPWQENERGVRSLGDLVWSARWEAFLDWRTAGLRLGTSWMGGPNAAGGRSDVAGLDLHMKWNLTAGQALRWLAFTAEGLGRRARVGAAILNPGTAEEVTIDGARLRDLGGYGQILVGLRERWSAGVRGEFATATGDSVVRRDGIDGLDSPSADPLRDRRLRISPLIQFHPSEFSRLRLQYDYDRAQFLPGGQAHSVWLGIEVLIGAHPAHGY